LIDRLLAIEFLRFKTSNEACLIVNHGKQLGIAKEESVMGHEILRHEIVLPTMPLAVYRELASHLRQVEGVGADLLPQTTPGFDYDRSQIGGLWYELPGGAPQAAAQARVDQILTYYRDRYLT
jgi:hypothetical protein